MRRAWGTCVAGVLCAVASACGAEPSPQHQPPPAAAQPAQPQLTRYDLKGKVVSIDKPTKRVTVDHGDIPGFMTAMTMPYAVKDVGALDTLAIGDEITAKIVSTGSDHWLEDIAVTARAAPK